MLYLLITAFLTVIIIITVTTLVSIIVSMADNVFVNHSQKFYLSVVCQIYFFNQNVCKMSPKPTVKATECFHCDNVTIVVVVVVCCDGMLNL